MVKKHVATHRLIRLCTIFTFVVLGTLFTVDIQNADGKKKKKVREFLKITVNLNIKWDVDSEKNKNTGYMNIRVQGLLKLNKEMSSMGQGLPAVMVNYKSMGNTLAFYSYKETITDKDPPEDCNNATVEKYEGAASTLLKTVPGPGNLIINHFASLFKDTGLGHMASPEVTGMLFDHYLLAIPFNEIEINGQKLDQSSCEWKPSTRKMKIVANIIGKVEKQGKMEGRHTWTAKADSSRSAPRVSVKVNELPVTMNNKKPYAPEKDSDGDVTYSLSWKIEETKPHVLIYRLKDDAWHDVTDATPDEEEQEIYPGEKVNLRAIVLLPGETGTPPPGKWEITEKGKILKDWKAGEDGTEEVKVETLDEKEIEFFWWKNVKTAKVKYTVKSKNISGKTEFKVVMPEVSVSEEPGTRWAFRTDVNECEILPDAPSMKVTSTVSIKKNKNFCLQYVQLVKSDNWSLKKMGDGFHWYTDIHGFMLDSTYPYNGEVCRAEAGSVPITMKDLPAANLEKSTASVYQDQEFQIYLMFRPGKRGGGNAWVPLRRINWGWKITAISKNNPWHYTHPQGQKIPVPPCRLRFDLFPPEKLPVNFNYRARKAREYPKWSDTAPEGAFMKVTEIKVEDVGNNYRNPPPK